MKRISIFTDGGCEGNPGPGGWAAILRYGERNSELRGGEPATTNNRMELMAAISALEALKEPCEIDFVTDSEYLREGLSAWVPKWKTKGWMLAGKKPVKNEDLWRRLDALAARHKIHWEWVRGHSGHPENERCDQLAQEEIAKIRQGFSRERLRELLETFKASRAPVAEQPGLFS